MVWRRIPDAGGRRRVATRNIGIRPSAPSHSLLRPPNVGALPQVARGVYFGRRNFATITGLSLMLPNLVSVGALAGILIAWLSEITGAYTLPLAIIAVIGAVGSLAFLFLGDPKLAPSQNSRLEMPVHLPEG